jgi:hypothetical protein
MDPNLNNLSASLSLVTWLINDVGAGERIDEAELLNKAYRLFGPSKPSRRLKTLVVYIVTLQSCYESYGTRTN